MKYISYIHFGINFYIRKKFLFSHNFHNFSFRADLKNNLLGYKNKRDPNEPVLMFIHPESTNMKGNMSRKCTYMYMNQSMQNLQNNYCDSVV